MAEFEIVLLDWENPGYGDVAVHEPYVSRSEHPGHDQIFFSCPAAENVTYFLIQHHLI